MLPHGSPAEVRGSKQRLAEAVHQSTTQRMAVVGAARAEAGWKQNGQSRR